MKHLSISILLITSIVICICLFDNYASRFGTGIFFTSYNELDFEPKVKFYEANFNLVTDKDFPLVYSGYNFPTAFIKDSKQIYVDSVFGMWVENQSLYVRVVDNFKNRRVIKINAVSENGVALDYDILEYETFSSKNKKGVYFDRSFLFMFALNWTTFFPIICILVLFVAYISPRWSKCCKRIKTM